MSTAAVSGSTKCPIQLTNPQLSRKLQAVKDTLGCPVSAEESDVFGEGYYVALENGAIFWLKDAPAAYALTGKILKKLWDLGGPSSQLGYPVSDITTTSSSQGQVARFQKGAVTVLPGKEPQVTMMLPGLIWR